MISWIPTLRRDSPSFDRVSQHSPSSPSSNSANASRRAFTHSMGLSLPPPPSTALTTPQRLEQLQQYSSSTDAQKLVKSYHVVPYDADDADGEASHHTTTNDLCEPLHASSDHSLRRKSARSMLASSRVQRDQLQRKMEELILKEAELASAYELFDYTRTRCSHEHALIVAKLTRYEELLRDAQSREAALQLDGVTELLSNDLERARWRETQNMVAQTLPELLARLEDNIDLNSAKIRSIQEKIDAIRAHRLAIREEIALKEEDIALALLQ